MSDDLEMLEELEELPSEPVKELSPKKKARAERREKKMRRVELKRLLRQLKKTKGPHSRPYREAEDELLKIEGDLQIEKEAETSTELKGKDMFEVAEQFEDNPDNLPHELKVLVERGIRLKLQLDKAEIRFAGRYCRLFRKDFREHYGVNFREQNYGQVFEGFVQLGTEGEEEETDEVDEAPEVVETEDAKETEVEMMDEI
jgi:hypothetical protein